MSEIEERAKAIEWLDYCFDKLSEKHGDVLGYERTFNKGHQIVRDIVEEYFKKQKEKNE